MTGLLRDPVSKGGNNSKSKKLRTSFTMKAKKEEPYQWRTRNIHWSIATSLTKINCSLRIFTENIKIKNNCAMEQLVLLRSTVHSLRTCISTAKKEEPYKNILITKRELETYIGALQNNNKIKH